MNQKRGRGSLLVGVLVASMMLLAWSVMSMWDSARRDASHAEAAVSASASENLPPALESKGVKASLLYPRLKGRGPQPGNDIPSRPLRMRPIQQESLKPATPQ
jgi:hypothetical protein